MTAECALSFSVVIPTYNRQAETERAIQSCLRQTEPPLEIIVVDDCSADAFVWSGDSRVRVIRHQQNCGGGRARNTGIDAARGNFICFLDSDDLWIPEKLAKVRRFLESAARVDGIVVFHDVLIVKDGVTQRHFRNPPVRADEDILGYFFLRGGLAQTSSLTVPRELARRARFDDALRIHQDLDFCFRLQRAGARFHRISEPLSIWHWDNGRDRVSETPGAERSMAWVRSLEGRAPDKVLAAIKALVIAPRLRPTDPQAALGYLLTAWRAGAIGTLRMLKRMWRLGFLNPAGVRMIWGARIAAMSGKAEGHFRP